MIPTEPLERAAWNVLAASTPVPDTVSAYVPVSILLDLRDALALKDAPKIGGHAPLLCEPDKGASMTAEESAAEALGELVAEELGLRRNEAGRWDLASGDKTTLGLGRTVRRWVEESEPETAEECPLSFDVYRAESDGTWVVHVQTDDSIEGEPGEPGPRCRVYLNDGDAIFENPPWLGTAESS